MTSTPARSIYCNSFIGRDFRNDCNAVCGHGRTIGGVRASPLSRAAALWIVRRKNTIERCIPSILRRRYKAALPSSLQAVDTDATRTAICTRCGYTLPRSLSYRTAAGDKQSISDGRRTLGIAGQTQVVDKPEPELAPAVALLDD